MSADLGEIRVKQKYAIPTVDELEDEIERLRAALKDMIEIATRNSDASLMLIAIRKCAEHALK